MKNELTDTQIDDIIKETVFYPNINMRLDFDTDETLNEHKKKHPNVEYGAKGNLSGKSFYKFCKEIDEEVSYIRDDKIKSKVLYGFMIQYDNSAISYSNSHRLYEAIYNDYKYGYSYSLQHYLNEFLDCFVICLKNNGSNYLDQSNTEYQKLINSFGRYSIHSEYELNKKSLVGISNVEIGKIEFEGMINEIEILISLIEAEKYCNKKIDKINRMPLIEAEVLYQKGIKLKWNGTKTQMYYVVRQLKQMQLLTNSYEDLGLFLIQNIKEFEDANLGTVINELQKTKYDAIPKNKRVDFSSINEVK